MVRRTCVSTTAPSRDYPPAHAWMRLVPPVAASSPASSPMGGVEPCPRSPIPNEIIAQRLAAGGNEFGLRTRAFTETAQTLTSRPISHPRARGRASWEGHQRPTGAKCSLVNRYRNRPGRAAAAQEAIAEAEIVVTVANPSRPIWTPWARRRPCRRGPGLYLPYPRNYACIGLTDVLRACPRPASMTPHGNTGRRIRTSSGGLARSPRHLSSS